jgi:hypothetical protein
MKDVIETLHPRRQLLDLHQECARGVAGEIGVLHETRKRGLIQNQSKFKWFTHSTFRLRAIKKPILWVVGLVVEFLKKQIETNQNSFAIR